MSLAPMRTCCAVPSSVFRWMVVGVLLPGLLGVGDRLAAAEQSSQPGYDAARQFDQRPQAAPGDWRFRPPSATNARGTPPGQPTPGAWSEAAPRQPPWPGRWSPVYPGGAVPGASRQPLARSEEPRLEVSLSSAEAFVHQSLILHLRLTSAGGLASAVPDLSAIANVQVELLEGPVSRMRARGNGREQVSDYFYLLRPLRSGPLAVTPVKVTGADLRGQAFSIQAEAPPLLEVLAAPPQVRPWLALEALSLSARLDPQTEIRAGRPVTLTLDMRAEGGTAEQLPSLEPMLRSAGFRSYRERTLTETRLTPDGRHLLAQRTEVYTLVPQSDGPLRLPEIRVAWWNLATASAEVARLPMRRLGGAAGAGDQTHRLPDDGEFGWWLGWIPLGIVLLVSVGFTLGVWVQTRRERAPGGAGGEAKVLRVPRVPALPRLRAREGDDRRPAQRDLGSRAEHGVARLRARGAAFAAARASVLIRARRRAGQWLVAKLPARWRFRRWLRQLPEHSAAAAVAQHLRGHALAAGWLAAGEPLAALARRLAPRASEERRDQLRRRLGELDAAPYGQGAGTPEQWRRDLLRLAGVRVGERLAAAAQAASRARGGALPPLNPKVADP